MKAGMACTPAAATAIEATRQRLSHGRRSTMSTLHFALLVVVLGESTGAAASATGFGPVQKGRTTFYGGAPDLKDPNEPSWGTLHGSCGYVAGCFAPSLAACFLRCRPATSFATSK